MRAARSAASSCKHTTALAGADAMHELKTFKKACRKLQPPEDYANVFG